MIAKTGPFTTEFRRLSDDLAAAIGDADREFEVARRFATLGEQITAACEHEYVKMTELPAA